MRSGGADDLEKCDHKTNAVFDEADGWRFLDPF